VRAWQFFGGDRVCAVEQALGPGCLVVKIDEMLGFNFGDAGVGYLFGQFDGVVVFGRRGSSG